MPYLFGTRALCRIGTGLSFGQIYLADKAVINLNVLPAGAVLVVAALMHDDLLNHLPQEGGGKFLKVKVLSDNPHKLFRVDNGGLLLVQFNLQSGGAELIHGGLFFSVNRANLQPTFHFAPYNTALPDKTGNFFLSDFICLPRITARFAKQGTLKKAAEAALL